MSVIVKSSKVSKDTRTWVNENGRVIVCADVYAREDDVYGREKRKSKDERVQLELMVTKSTIPLLWHLEIQSRSSNIPVE